MDSKNNGDHDGESNHDEETEIPSGNTDRGFTDRELMVCAAAAEIENDDVAFVGMRLPLIAFQLAVSTHAPDAMAVYESGVVRDDPADGFLHTMCDLPNQNRAIATTGMLDIMGRLQRGDVDVGFLGGAEIDRYGNLNTTRVRAGDREIRLPGSGGACDIACLSGRTVIVMAHEPRRFVESVEYNTSPGHGSGGDWRADNGLPGVAPRRSSRRSRRSGPPDRRFDPRDIFSNFINDTIGTLIDRSGIKSITVRYLIVSMDT